MKLHFRTIGEGRPVIILHGLFGSSDNWYSFGKNLSASGFKVYLVDLRNHGLSPHSDEFNFQVLSEDVFELMKNENLNEAILIGHSLGGKTAMQLSLNHPEDISHLIVVDISPRYYPVHHDGVIAAIKSVDLDEIKTRKEAEEKLSQGITDSGTKQLLLKNLYWKEENKLAWRFNLSSIEKNIEETGAEIKSEKLFSKPTLFIKGEYSGYIQQNDWQLIIKLFPNAELEVIKDARHWVHADKPEQLMEKIIVFLNS